MLMDVLQLWVISPVFYDLALNFDQLNFTVCISVLNISQSDSLLPKGHLVMFPRATLHDQAGLEHECRHP